MNAAASIDVLPDRIRLPPNHSTRAIAAVPRNSLMGWARDWRRATALER